MPTVLITRANAQGLSVGQKVAVTDVAAAQLVAANAAVLADATVPLQVTAADIVREALFGVGAPPRAWRGDVASQAAMLALPTVNVGDWVRRTDLTNQVFELTAAGQATLANWTVYPVGAGGVRTFRGIVASQAAMLALASAVVGDWCERSDLSNQVFELTTAGPSTLANWTSYPLAASNAPRVETASFTVVKGTHDNRRVDYNSASAGNATIDASTLFTTDDGARFVQDGAGALTLVASGLTFLNPFAFSLTTTGAGSWIDVEWNATLAKYVVMDVSRAVSSGAGYWTKNVNGTDVAGVSADSATLVIPANTWLPGGMLEIEPLWTRSGNNNVVACKILINATVVADFGSLNQNAAGGFQDGIIQIRSIGSTSQYGRSAAAGQAAQAPNASNGTNAPGVFTFDQTTALTIHFFIDSFNALDIARLRQATVTIKNPN